MQSLKILQSKGEREKIEKIRIVIIDSGVDNRNLNCVKDTLSLEINPFGKVTENLKNEVTNEHGTIIASLIYSIFEKIEYISISILDENLSTSIEQLAYALEKAVLYSPHIIHVSLGTKKWKHKYRIEKIINDISKKNIIVVAAASNDGKSSYPAYLKNVIGVKTIKDRERKVIYKKGSFYYAPGNVPEEIYTIEGQHLTGNSFAAGYVTGYISKIIYFENIEGVKNIKKYLKMRKVIHLHS